MNCSRCHGLMVREHFLDFDGTIGQMWASGHRCMNCGNASDSVIEQHRQARTKQTLVPLSHEIYHEEYEQNSQDILMPAA
jgi:hypothetical protein